MFKFRQLLTVGTAFVVLMALMIPFAAAQPAQQATATPGATTAATQPAQQATATPGATAAATLVSTPSTLPATGGSDDGAATLGLIVLVVGALMVVGAVGLVMSRRTS